MEVDGLSIVPANRLCAACHDPQEAVLHYPTTHRGQVVFICALCLAGVLERGLAAIAYTRNDDKMHH